MSADSAATATSTKKPVRRCCAASVILIHDNELAICSGAGAHGRIEKEKENHEAQHEPRPAPVSTAAAEVSSRKEGLSM